MGFDDKTARGEGSASVWSEFLMFSDFKPTFQDKGPSLSFNTAYLILWPHNPQTLHPVLSFIGSWCKEKVSTVYVDHCICRPSPLGLGSPVGNLQLRVKRPPSSKLISFVSMQCLGNHFKSPGNGSNVLTRGRTSRGASDHTGLFYLAVKRNVAIKLSLSGSGRSDRIIGQQENWTASSLR